MSDDFDDPKETIRLLGKLVRKGFTDKRFKEIHHFGKRATIAGHLKHCQTVERFRSGGNNCRVQERLRDELSKMEG